MSLTKRWIDDEKSKGNDPLNEEHDDMLDDEYWYNDYCHYSGLPSINVYKDKE